MEIEFQIVKIVIKELYLEGVFDECCYKHILEKISNVSECMVGENENE